MRCRSATTMLALAWVFLAGTALAAEGLESTEQIRRGLIPITGDAPSAPSVNLNVTFASGSAQLTGQARKQLDFLARALASASLASFRFAINGHTDARGSRVFNQRLSEQRARSVKDYLVRRHEFPSERLQVAGYGEDRLRFPKRPNDERNRRVEIVNIGPVPVDAATKRTPPPEKSENSATNEQGMTAVGAD